MSMTWLLAALHLLALGIGLGAIVVRARALAAPLDPPGIQRVFRADTAWGLAALLWISTGLLRAFAGFEKGTQYYLGNDAFWIKMGLFGLVFALEIFPMVTLIRWRIAARGSKAVDTSHALAMAQVSYVQAALVVTIVFAATAMARAIGYSLW